MDVMCGRCRGLGGRKKTVGACLVTPSADGKPGKQVRGFGTVTADLLTLSDWLTEHGVTHVAMKSSGVSWKPTWNLLEDTFQLLLADAQHTKTVPSRKSDVKDREWIADLLPHGSLKASFVPDRAGGI